MVKKCSMDPHTLYTYCILRYTKMQKGFCVYLLFFFVYTNSSNLRKLNIVIYTECADDDVKGNVF